MLGLIYELVRGFEREHGMPPNILYLNDEHFQRLRRECGDPDEMVAMLSRLKLDVVLCPEVMHPQVAYRDSLSRQALAG